MTLITWALCCVVSLYNYLSKLQQVTAKHLISQFEIRFVGRKKREHEPEAFIPGSILLTNVTYSHWALAYVLSLSGAQKLLKAEPLAKMIPVDEYIPIMYDQHPNQVWAEAFSDRNVKVRKTGILIENV